MKKNIAVIGGGDSSEWVVSVKSARQVSNEIDRGRYNVYDVYMRHGEWLVQQSGQPDVEIDKNDFSFTAGGQKVRFDCAVIVIHGTPGEDGILQSYFELVKVPYTTCNPFVSALTFNKYATKCFLRDTGITMAKEVMVKKGRPVSASGIVSLLGLPVFVKPNAAGSSFGVSKIKSEAELETALENAYTEDSDVIIEEFISGREFSHGIFKTAGGDVYNFPVTEIISKNEFFDYEAKYDGKSSDEITPADLDEATVKQIQELSSLIYDCLNCTGIVRIDYIVKNGIPHLLEINTVPGMSEASIVPQQIRHMGYTVGQMMSILIEDAIARSEKGA